MAFNNTITFTERSHGLMRHNHFPIRVTVTDIPAGLALTNAWLTVKVNESDPDPGLFQLAITTTLTSAGQITDTGVADRTGEVFFTPTPTQVNTMIAGRTYAGDIKLRYSDSQLRPLLKFTMTPGEGVTQATA